MAIFFPFFSSGGNGGGETVVSVSFVKAVTVISQTECCLHISSVYCKQNNNNNGNNDKKST